MDLERFGGSFRGVFLVVAKKTGAETGFRKASGMEVGALGKLWGGIGEAMGRFGEDLGSSGKI